MRDNLISLYIDNEMTLDNKVQFVETVHASRGFTRNAIELLHQEKILTGEMVTRIPEMKAPEEPPKLIFPRWLRPVAVFTVVLSIFAIVWFRYDLPRTISGVGSGIESVSKIKVPHRFVIYRPDARQAEIIGTFTDWQPVIMENAGSSGYWTITLNLYEGEHRYSYRVEKGQQMADPTVRLRESDDFGGENSIIEVKSAI